MQNSINANNTNNVNTQLHEINSQYNTQSLVTILNVNVTFLYERRNKRSVSNTI